MAPTGTDANADTLAAPFLTIQRAQDAVTAGYTVWVRGGTYMMQNAQMVACTNPYANITRLNKSGSATAGCINY